MPVISSRITSAHLETSFSTLLGSFILLPLFMSVTGLPQTLTHREQRMENCCGDLGCFDVTGVFLDLLKRPINPLPDCETKVVFTLRTRDNVEVPNTLYPNEIHTINVSHFRAQREGTKLLIHGYIGNGNNYWMTLMEKKLLLHGDFNVIKVDWSAGSILNYFQSAANARVVGSAVAKLLKVLKEKFLQDMKTVHIIGHSLGAHVAGYAGKLLHIGRITGLDPAGLYFMGMPHAVRLDPSDADFVDTVITDGRDLTSLGFGSLQPMGHLNFYPNGGKSQPGCDKSVLATLFDTSKKGLGAETDLFGCSHFRAPMLYADTIATPGNDFVAVECASYEEFLSGRCFSCENRRCTKMGLDLEENLTTAGTPRAMYLTTGRSTPFAVPLYRVLLKLRGDSKAANGILKIQLQGESRSTDWISMSAEYYLFAKKLSAKVNSERLFRAVEIKAGQNFVFVISGLNKMGRITAITVSWEYEYSILHPFEWLSTHVLQFEDKIELTELNRKYDRKLVYID